MTWAGINSTPVDSNDHPATNQDKKTFQEVKPWRSRGQPPRHTSLARESMRARGMSVSHPRVALNSPCHSHLPLYHDYQVLPHPVRPTMPGVTVKSSGVGAADRGVRAGSTWRVSRCSPQTSLSPHQIRAKPLACTNKPS